MSNAKGKFDIQRMIINYLVVLFIFGATFCCIRIYQANVKYHNLAQQIQSWQKQIQKNQIEPMSVESIYSTFRMDILEEILFLTVGLGCFLTASSVVVWGLIKKVVSSNAFLAQSLDAINHPVFVLNAMDETVVMTNRIAAGDQELMQGKCAAVCRQKEMVCDPKTHRCILDQVRVTGKPAVVEREYSNVNGQTFIKVHANPIFDAVGQLTHILCYALDVTQEKKTEEELRARRENLQAIFEMAPVGMLLIDETLKIQMINKACTDLVGQADGNVTGMLPGNAMHCLSAIESPGGCGSADSCRGCNLRGVLDKVLQNNQPASLKDAEMSFVVNGDRRLLHLEISALPIMLHNERNIVVVINNMTERRIYEEQLRFAQDQAERALARAEKLNKRLDSTAQEANKLAQQAMSASQAKSTFLATMSHEIRTPMNAILGFSELLTETQLDDHQQSFVRLIRTSGTTLLGLINDVLDFSKIEAGKLSIDKTNTELDVVLEEMQSMFHPMAAKKGVDLEILQCDDLPRVIQTDPMRLRQCLINLLNNAIKFTDSGHVYVNVSTQQKHGKYLIQFDVEDTGIGIDADKQQSIFEAFTQADTSIAQKFGGTGLGLSITKKLAVLLGGDVAITSQPGVGSIFTLMIDVTESKTAPQWNKYDSAEEVHRAEQKPEPEQKIDHASILVAEDNPVNQQLMRALLTRMGHQVTLVENGQLAVEHAEKTAYDLILMDVQMPVLNGLDATHKIRDKGITTPIIAVTANALKGDSDQCIAAGCDDYLSKPIDKKRLIVVLERYLVKSKTA